MIYEYTLIFNRYKPDEEEVDGYIKAKNAEDAETQLKEIYGKMGDFCIFGPDKVSKKDLLFEKNDILKRLKRDNAVLSDINEILGGIMNAGIFLRCYLILHEYVFVDGVTCLRSAFTKDRIKTKGE